MDVLIAMAAFVLSHVVIARTRLKPALIARFGEPAYLAAYSALSLALLAWVIWAVLTADRLPLWTTPAWSYGFAAIVSLVAFVLIGIGMVVPNPLSVSFRKAGFDPDRSGVIGWVRHPLLWGLTLWAVSHIPANGDWPSLVLFAGAATFGLVGIFAVERRVKRQLGLEEWTRLTAGRGNVDRRAIAGAAVGVFLWLVFLVIHPTLFGADPLAVLRAQFG